MILALIGSFLLHKEVLALATFIYQFPHLSVQSSPKLVVKGPTCKHPTFILPDQDNNKSRHGKGGGGVTWTSVASLEPGSRERASRLTMGMVTSNCAYESNLLAPAAR